MPTTQTLPMFPLGGVTLPGESLPLHVFEDRYQQLLEDCLASDDGPIFGVVLIERGSEVGGQDTRTDVGTRMRIVRHRGMGPGHYLVECIGESRLRVLEWLEDAPYPRARVTEWPDGPGPARQDVADVAEAITGLYSAIERLAQKQDAQAPPPPNFDELPIDPGDRLYKLAAQVPMGQADRQAILAAPGIVQRKAALLEGIAGVHSIVEFQLTEPGAAQSD